MDVTQTVPELVVVARLSQGEKVKTQKKRRKCQGRSIEEMKERPGIVVEEDTEEMEKWRSVNQSGMDF